MKSAALLALLLPLSPLGAFAEPAANPAAPTPAAPAAEAPTKGVDVSLLSENAAIAAGKKFTVGLKIHHHPGFHTYWRSPGAAGVPVEIAWQLPEGFKAGPIQWPYPQRSMMSIHPVHGYERDVLLLVEITPPAALPAASASTAELKATASWMACADGCYPGKKELSLSLPVAAQASPDPALAETFAKARTELPRALEHWKVELVSEPDAAEIRLRLSPADDQALALVDPYFFSSDGQISSKPVQTLQVKEGGVIEITAPRAQYGPKVGKSLPGVLLAKSPLWKGGPAFALVYPGDDPSVMAGLCPDCAE